VNIVMDKLYCKLVNCFPDPEQFHRIGLKFLDPQLSLTDKKDVEKLKNITFSTKFKVNLPFSRSLSLKIDNASYCKKCWNRKTIDRPPCDTDCPASTYVKKLQYVFTSSVCYSCLYRPLLEMDLLCQLEWHSLMSLPIVAHS